MKQGWTPRPAGNPPRPAGNPPRREGKVPCPAPQKWSKPRGSGGPNKGDSVISFQIKTAIMKQYVNTEQ